MSIISFDQYLEFLGFPAGQNPFASVNARDERAVLEGYFVPPPYFETLWGSPAEPKSAVVLAPTGGGKTALAVMIDERAISIDTSSEDRLPVLPILYDDFSRLGLNEQKQSLEEHFIALNYLLTINVLTNVAQTELPNMRISPEERLLLRHCFAKYVGGKAHTEVFQDLEKIRTPWERIQGTAQKVVKALPVISLLAKALELGVERLQLGIELTKAVAQFKEDTRSLEATPETDFYRLIEFATKYYESVYILVDRVDETPWTQRNAEATYNLIHPLAGNLNLLDRPERLYAFKFFLWDGIEPFYRKYARDDRIFARHLEWKPDQLIQMIDNRVRAFSKGKIQSVDELFESNLEFTSIMRVPEMLAIFAGTSPRTIVTLCKYMVEEEFNLIQSETGQLKRIGERAVIAGLNKYSNEVAHRLIDDEKALREITSIGRIVFTSKSLHSDLFRGHTPESVRSKVGKWKRFEVFKPIGNEVTGQRGFPTEIHAFSEPCVAYLSAGLPLKDFLENKTRRCTNCGAVLLRDFERGGNFQCRDCLANFELPRLRTEAQELRQAAIRKVARDVARIHGEPADIHAICRAANTPLGDETFAGASFLIWLRVFQFLEENDLPKLIELLEVVEDSLPEGSRVRTESLPELYYMLTG